MWAGPTLAGERAVAIMSLWYSVAGEECMWAGPTQRKKEKEKTRAAGAALVHGD